MEQELINDDVGSDELPFANKFYLMVLSVHISLSKARLLEIADFGLRPREA